MNTGKSASWARILSFPMSPVSTVTSGSNAKQQAGGKSVRDAINAGTEIGIVCGGLPSLPLSPRSTEHPKCTDKAQSEECGSGYERPLRGVGHAFA